MPRSQFSQGALYEIGSALSLFQAKNYADEFRAALEGKILPRPVTQDETVAAVAEDRSDETSRDFVSGRHWRRNLKAASIRRFRCASTEHDGLSHSCIARKAPTVASTSSLAHNGRIITWFEPPIVKVQVKSTEWKRSAIRSLQALYGKVGIEIWPSGDFGYIHRAGAIFREVQEQPCD